MIACLVVIGIAFLACLMFGLGWFVRSQQKDDEYSALLARNVRLYSEVRAAKADSSQNAYHLDRIREALQKIGVSEERLLGGKYRLRKKTALQKPGEDVLIVNGPLAETIRELSLT